jgi:hypothetical protein
MHTLPRGVGAVPLTDFVVRVLLTVRSRMLTSPRTSRTGRSSSRCVPVPKLFEPFVSRTERSLGRTVRTSIPMCCIMAVTRFGLHRRQTVGRRRIKAKLMTTV